MQRLLTFLAVCVLGSVMALAQDAGQAPASGTQSGGNSTNAVPNSNGTSPSSAPGQARRTPSSPNQALPGDSNPANSATRDGQANGSAVRPNSDSRNANPADSPDSNIKRDDTGSNPASTHPPTNTDMGTRTFAPWLWIALGVIAVIALISALARRSRVATEVDDRDPRWRTGEPEVIRREEIYRARRDNVDRDDEIRRAS